MRPHDLHRDARHADVEESEDGIMFVLRDQKGISDTTVALLVEQTRGAFGPVSAHF